MAVKIKANAKINLMLDILSRLDNGYHDLFMIMQSVSLADELTLDITDSGKIEITCSNPEIPTDERNIAHKAAEAFFAFIGINNPGLRINIVKRIPHAAGLGGGSADGAGVIQGLNRLFDAKLSEKDLITV
ncbi:MAG: 4-(cytidine 5'-diphospho)-2-C-methyl-D-erythritol kinase, partial [Oscillospiraceae bacterium]|nr:4-(cytidine 5'-diphospho)-2-C-methyl-D-erythritol kinase [Oscillospiraceae bacterium]